MKTRGCLIFVLAVILVVNLTGCGPGESQINIQEIVEQSAWGDIAGRFNKTSAPVLRLAKEAFRLGLRTAPDESFEVLKNLFLDRLYRIEDVNEGIASFAEKRKPEWKHR